MISYETVLGQMEQLVAQAKNNSSDQQIREQLTAIRALCDIVLQQSTVPAQQASKPAVASTIMQPAPSLPTASHKWQEQDANGDSIFDF